MSTVKIRLMTDWKIGGPALPINEASIDSFVRQTSLKKVPEHYYRRRKPITKYIDVYLDNRVVATLHPVYSKDDSVDQKARWEITSSPKWVEKPTDPIELSEIIKLLNIQITKALRTKAYWPVIYDKYQGWMVPTAFLDFELAFGSSDFVDKWIESRYKGQNITFKSVQGTLVSPPSEYLPKSRR